MTDLIYRLDNKNFEVDACLPQISAVNEGKIQMSALSNGDYPGIQLPRGALSGISSLGFIDSSGDQDWGMEDHRNEGIEICYQESGSNTLVVDGKNYPTPAHTISITRPWQLHRVGNPNLGPGCLHWIIIDVGVRRPNQNWKWPNWCILTPEDLKELTRILRGNEHPVWEADNEILRIFKRLAHYTTSEQPTKHASRIMVTANQLLIALLEKLRSQKIVTDDSLTTVSRTVELFLSELKRTPETQSMPWTLDSMATHCGMGRSTFSKYCYQLQNVSPIDYLNRCRLESAATRLTNEPTSSVTEIAYDSGFSSSQYFSKAFKRHFKTTPSQWRQNANG